MAATFVTPGVVLSRRPYGEYDLVAVLYTEALGKLPARFVGVRRPRGKLKALAEPMVHGEYRLYVRPGGEWATATGGRIVDSHPGLRLDFDRTCRGLRVCELLLRLAPDHAPSPAKLELVLGALAALAAGPAPWVPLAFGLRLLELAGFGVARGRPAQVAPPLWAALHREPLEALAARPDDGSLRDHLEGRLDRLLQELIERPLATTLFADALNRFSPSAGVPS